MSHGKPEIFPVLAKQIRTYFESQGILPGDRLPSELKLAEMFSYNHLTVRKALKVLAEQEILYARPNRGYFWGRQSGENKISAVHIGFMFPEDDIFYYRIFAEVEKVVASKGLHPVVHLTGGSEYKEKKLLDFFEHSGVCALIAVPNQLCTEYYRKLTVPVLFFDMRLPGLNIPQIVSDDYSGAYTATEQLIRLGHHHIAHIGIDQDYTGEQRLNGYLDALREYGIPRRKALIRMQSPSREWGYYALREMIRSGYSLDAVFCANDTIAAGVVNFCADRQIRIPEELSVAGFGDTPTAEYLNLSSVSQNAGRISGALCTNLEKLLAGQTVPPLTVIPTSWVPRKSVSVKK